MNKSEDRAVIFYTSAIVLALALSTALIVTLDWPVAAEIPLSISVFIKMVTLAKTWQMSQENSDTEHMLEVFSHLKAGFFDPKPREN